jgi:hypothetical protein
MSLTFALGLLAAAAAEAPKAGTPESDLRCAAWSAYMMDKAKDEDQEAATGIGFTMTYFLGRWEAATGKPFEEGLTPEFVGTVAPNIESLTDECLGRMQAFGSRMGGLGGKLKENGKAN